MYQSLTKIYNILAATIAIVVLLFTLQQFYTNSALLVHPDLFINYEGGFIRRGLDGHFLFLLSTYFQINFINLVKVYIIITFFAFIIAIVIIKFKKNIPSFVLFSMSTLLLYFLYLDKGVRKDHIILIFILLQSIFFSKDKIFTNFWTKLLFVILNIVGTLIHEIFFILTFFPVIIGFWILSKNNIHQFLKHLLLIAPTFFLFLLLMSVFSGNLIQINKVISSYQNLDYNLDYLRLLYTKTYYFWEQNYNAKNLFLFIFMLFLHGIYILTSIYPMFKNNNRKLYFLILMMLEFLVLLFFCMIAIDYSRMVFFCFFTITIYSYQYKLNNPMQKNQSIEKVDHFLNKLKYLPFILFFFNTMPHSYWNGIDGIKKHNLWVQLKNKFIKE